MAITSALCNSFKQELMEAKHDFLTHTMQYVFIKNTHSGTYGASVTNAGTPGSGAPVANTSIGTDAAAATGTYVAAGNTLAFDSPTLFSSTAVAHPTSSITLTGTSFNSGNEIRGMVLFNNSASKRTIWCLDFGSSVSTTSATLTITWPTKNATTGMIRIA